MQVNIIHLDKRWDRLSSLKKELAGQQISNYRIWPGIVYESNRSTGISRAHKQIVQFAKDSHLPQILIAEDDLHFTTPGAFSYFINSIPEEFDLYLAGIYYGSIGKDNRVNDFSGLTLYLVNFAFYDTFLSIDESQDLDRGLSGKGRFIVCNPFAAIQHDGYSDHFEEFKSYKIF